MEFDRARFNDVTNETKATGPGAPMASKLCQPVGFAMNAGDCLAAFRDALQDVGLRSGAPIIADGKLHRIHIEGDKQGSKNAGMCCMARAIPLALSVAGKQHRRPGAPSLIVP